MAGPRSPGQRLLHMLQGTAASSYHWLKQEVLLHWHLERDLFRNCSFSDRDERSPGKSFTKVHSLEPTPVSKACSGALRLLWRSLHTHSRSSQPCAQHCTVHTWFCEARLSLLTRLLILPDADSQVLVTPCRAGHELHVDRAYHPRAAVRAEHARAALATHRASIIEIPGDDSTCKANAGSVAHAITLYPVCESREPFHSAAIQLHITMWHI